MISTGQRTAVLAAFRLAGYDGELFTLPVTSGDELLFVLPPNTAAHPRQYELEQVLAQLLDRRAAVLCSENFWARRVPF